MQTGTVKKVEAKFIAPIDEAELAVRMCEASYGLKRPPSSTASQALDAMSDECRDGWRRAARAAMNYWSECIANAQQTN